MWHRKRVSCAMQERVVDIPGFWGRAGGCSGQQGWFAAELGALRRVMQVRVQCSHWRGVGDPPANLTSAAIARVLQRRVMAGWREICFK